MTADVFPRRENSKLFNTFFLRRTITLCNRITNTIDIARFKNEFRAKCVRNGQQKPVEYNEANRNRRRNNRFRFTWPKRTASTSTTRTRLWASDWSLWNFSRPRWRKKKGKVRPYYDPYLYGPGRIWATDWIAPRSFFFQSRIAKRRQDLGRSGGPKHRQGSGRVFRGTAPVRDHGVHRTRRPQPVP